MHAQDSGVPNFDLPEEVLAVLPSDPFQQLDIARKITSIALATRVSKLESEASRLLANLTEKDAYISELHAQIEALDASLADTADKLARADEEKEALLKENASLSNTVKKLNRDVSKLEVFRKTLMQSLQEEEETSQAAAPKIVVKLMPGENAILPPSRSSSIQSQFSETGNSFTEDGDTDASRPRVSQGLLLASQASTPKVSPPVSPPSLSVSGSPTRMSKPVSPRRHSISFSTSRGRTRIDGKEFFRQVRSRLSYEQFGAFLANVKELNSHKQTREETLQKADEIFGPDNKDLYSKFEGLITRNVH
ncbi:PREDICTED: uncharacterized protein At4g15545 isoform X2 [Nelumbo nucifera]|uniref:At4g15545-like C-terminal domain-containing protein n=2 Tax=Nelumbo nucifera TaxID=4432 RepID=A0A822Z049_NELNU|nr:PREDICTED: uncharacterized protein At4g15545 isoform X2 [Nelumbo nucifera]DAD37863.1 TPA_asm: hypothetical protein HUJ06_008504 [Nelumbo nucifera]